jgi:hypothetical protein
VVKNLLLERDWFRPNRAVGDFNLPKR